MSRRCFLTALLLVAACGSTPMATPGIFTCGNTYCRSADQYCIRYVSDIAGSPDSYSCHAVTQPCGDAGVPSCACVTNNCFGTCSELPQGGVLLICPGG